jgi:hypothetical protein
MNVLIKSIKSFFLGLFTRTKKLANLPQGEEYENWLGV